MSKKTYSVLLAICIYSLSTANFYYSFFEDDLIPSFIELIVRIIGIIFIIRLINTDDLPRITENRFRLKHLYFIPFLIIPFSNLICSYISNGTYYYADWFYYVKNILLMVLVAFGEELVFRGILQVYLQDKTTDFKALVFASLIFGGMHLLSIGSIGSILPALLQMTYSFGIGLVVGLMYMGSSKFSYSFVFHFMFNVFNQVVASRFAYNTKIFYIVNIVIALVFIIYGTFVYFKLIRRKEYVS